MNHLQVWRAVLLISTVAATAFSATFVVPEDAELIRRSHAIVTGEVLASYAQLGAGGNVETVTEIRIARPLKGPFRSGEIVRLVVPAGAFGEQRKMIGGMPNYQVGSEVLAMVRQTGPNRWATTDLALGKFEFRTDRRGQKLLVRDEAEIRGWDLEGREHSERRRDAARFVEFIRATVQSPTAVEHDYFVESYELEEPAVTEDITAMAVSATPRAYGMANGELDPGFRWNVFPSAVSFVSSNSITGGVTAIEAGMSAWNNDCASNVNYGYSGVGPAGQQGVVGSPDGINSVRFEVDLSSLGASPYVCASGGTLGVGGPSKISGSHNHPVSGESFYTTIEGDVDMNIGIAACTLTQLPQDKRNSALAHELGHTLGFRHSNMNRSNSADCADPLPCSNAQFSAIMYASIGSGLNAVLQPWDSDAVRSVYAAGSCPVGGVRGDFNSDGNPDLIWRNYDTGAVNVWHLNGTTYVSGANLFSVSDPNWRIEGTGDFNLDGKPDLVWRNYTTGAVNVWYLSNGTYLGGATLFTVADLNWRIQAVADMNSDGKDDLIWRNYSTGAVNVWYMNGSTYAGGASLFSVTDLNWRIEGAGDFNGDGKPDLVWRNYANGDVNIWYLSNGVYLGGANLFKVTDLDWNIEAVADYNKDGRPDLIWRNYRTGDVNVWFMNGATYAGGANLYKVADPKWEIAGPR
jgi:hypothetical protein